jgi:hypothetical protein
MFKARNLIPLILLPILLFTTACGGSSNDPPTSTGRGVGTQDIYVFEYLYRFDDAGEPVNLTDQVLSEANSSLGTSLSLNTGFTFREAQSIEGYAVDENGDKKTNITMNFGIISDDTNQRFVAIASADLEKENSNLDIDDNIVVDLTFIEELEIGETTAMDYIFAQTIPPDDPSTEEGMTYLEIFSNRWNNPRQLVFLGVEIDDELFMAEIFGQEATIVEGSTGWQWASKGFKTAGNVIKEGATGMLAGGAAGVTIGGAVGGLLGSGTGPGALGTAAVGAGFGAIGGCVIGGWAGVISATFCGISDAIDNNISTTSVSTVPMLPTVAPTPVPTATPVPTPVPQVSFVNETGDSRLVGIDTLIDRLNLPEDKKAQLLIAYLLDPDGDWIYSILGVDPGKKLGIADIIGNGSGVLRMDQNAVDSWFNNSIFPCGELTEEGWLTVCTDGYGPVPPGDVFLVYMVLDGEIPLEDPDNFYTYGAVFDADGNTANNFQAQSPYNWDYFQGTDRWYELDWDPNLGVWTLYVNEQWNPMVSNARSVIMENVVLFFIPADEFSVERPEYRLSAFVHDGTYAAENSGGDVPGANPEEPLLKFPQGPIEIEGNIE